MATVPLRIDTELVNRAREAAALMDRTPTAQIEFWAKLGRVMEGVLTHDAIVTIKDTSRVKRLDEVFALVSTPEGKERALAEIRRHKGPTYSVDPHEPAVVMESMPDGSKRRGLFVNRRFTPLIEKTGQ